jgi:predicted component of type VI protein secretion system
LPIPDEAMLYYAGLSRSRPARRGAEQLIGDYFDVPCGRAVRRRVVSAAQAAQTALGEEEGALGLAPLRATRSGTSRAGCACASAPDAPAC